MSLTDKTIAARAAWLPEVEEATDKWRRLRAERYLQAGERTALVDLERTQREEAWQEFRDTACVTPIHWPSDGIGVASRTLPVNGWHYQRAMATLDRFNKLTECDQLARTVCCECGDYPTRTAVLHCDHWRLCLACRGRRAKRYRARFERGRSSMLKRYHRELCQVSGRWSEKFGTFTIPHSGGVGRDVAELHHAWPLVRGSLGRYLTRKGIPKWRNVPYWRSLEVTASDNGHAHYHVWMLAPFIPRILLAHWWGRALSPSYRAKLPRILLSDALAQSPKRDWAELRRAAIVEPQFEAYVRSQRRRATRARATYGRDTMEARNITAEVHALVSDASYLYAPVIDVRACDDDTGTELVKYIVKDCSIVDGAVTPMDAKVYAAIYAATDGVHTLATSHHWISEAPPAEQWCPCCGSHLEVRVVHSRSLLHQPQAPPKPGA